MLSVFVVISADNTDALSGTDLENAPGPGIMEIYVASTQGDTVVSVSAGERTVKRLQKVVQRTNGMPLVSDDPAIAYMTGGEKNVVNVDIVTAATVGIIANYTEA